MKKIIIAIIALFIAIPVFAGGSSPKCNTKYPVILAHGMAATDDMLGVIDYWWGIENAIENEGGNVYVTKVNCMDSTENKGKQFRDELARVLAISGASKVNIIGHSHGGLYSRYAISNLTLDGQSVSKKVASLTTLCTPHRGSSAADVIVGLAGDTGGWLIGVATDWIYGFLMGDQNPQSYDNAITVTRNYVQNVFNPNTPNKSGIYYQSYATKIKTITADMVLEPTWLLIKFYEGANDGLVSETSAKWGNYRGMESGAWWSGGVSHINAIGHFFGITPGFSAKDKMVSMVEDLKNRGY